MAESCSGSPLDFLGMFGDPVGTIMEIIAKAIMAGALSAFEALGSGIDTYNVTASGVVASQTRWIVVYLAIGSLLFASIKMAMDRRGDAGQTALKGMLRVLVVSACAATVMSTFASLM